MLTKRYRIIRGTTAAMLVLGGCGLIAGMPQPGFAVTTTSGPDTAMPVPKEPPKEGDIYQGFYVLIRDDLGTDELTEDVEIHLLGADDADQTIRLTLGGETVTRTGGFVGESGTTRPPPYKSFQIRFRLRYLPKNPDGSPGALVRQENTRSMTLPYGAALMLSRDASGALTLRPVE